MTVGTRTSRYEFAPARVGYDIDPGGGQPAGPARPGPGPEGFLKEMPMGIPEGNAFKDPLRKCRCGNLR